MTIRTHYLAAVAAIGALAVPAAAQTAYPYGYQQQQYQQYQQAPQPYPGQPGYAYSQGYAQPAYGYNQGYSQNPVAQVIDSLLGNRYTVSDRTAVSQCASAAMSQAAAQYGGYNRGGMRVTSITDVQRRNNGLRVSGTMSSGYGGQYGNQYGYQHDSRYGYQNRGYEQPRQVSFRCNVASNGAVTNIRIGRNNAYRG
jgi:hypothetical protein